MPVHDRSAMTFHLSRGKLIGSLDLTTPLEAERPVGCPSGHIAAPLTSAIVIREAAQNAGAEARVPDASKQHRTNQARREPSIRRLGHHSQGRPAMESATSSTVRRRRSSIRASKCAIPRAPSTDLPGASSW